MKKVAGTPPAVSTWSVPLGTFASPPKVGDEFEDTGFVNVSYTNPRSSAVKVRAAGVAYTTSGLSIQLRATLN